MSPGSTRTRSPARSAGSGFTAKLMGDGVLAYFGWPRAHEDEAERAVRAGLAVITAVARLPTPADEPLGSRRHRDWAGGGRRPRRRRRGPRASCGRRHTQSRCAPARCGRARNGGRCGCDPPPARRPVRASRPRSSGLQGHLRDRRPPSSCSASGRSKAASRPAKAAE